MGSRMMQPRLAEMNPLMGLRLGPPQEWSLDCLEGVRFHVDQEKAPLVCSRRYRTVVIRTVTSAWTGLPSDGAGLPRGHQRPLKLRQQRRECCLGEPRPCRSAPGTLDPSLVAWHRHLRHAMSGREA
jgi:hypothetical protein